MFWLIFSILLLFYIAIRQIVNAIRKPKSDYWDGPAPTRLQQKRNKESVFKVIEQFPDGHLAKSNPEYVEEYLQSIDLDLPEGVTTTKQ